jgi:hypothetical protein
MANKQRKKRNKKYQGVDAKVTAPTVLRFEAEERSPLKEWWLQYRQMIRVIATIVGVLLIIILIITGIVMLFQR